MNTNTTRRILPGRQWVAVAVVVGCILILTGLLLPAIHNARQAAWRTQSKNNLKQLGLALYNYHDTYSVFPLGGDISTGDTAMHGWFIRTVPYLESSSLYVRTNMHKPWNHPVNDVLFKQAFHCITIPGNDQCYTIEGYGLLHYMANPNVMHRNHCISIQEMTTGTANNWFCGEVSGNYQPWAYPLNWRSLRSPLNSGANSYGAWYDGGHFGLADGSVRFLSNTTDTAMLTSLANAPPIATKEQIVKPDRGFEVASKPLRRNWFVSRIQDHYDKGVAGTTILYDRANRPYYADVYDHNETGEPIWDVDHTTRIDLQGVLENFPEIRILNVSVVNDESAAIIAQFPDLEFLQAWEYDLTEKGDAILKAHPKLKTTVHR